MFQIDVDYHSTDFLSRNPRLRELKWRVGILRDANDDVAR